LWGNVECLKETQGRITYFKYIIENKKEKNIKKGRSKIKANTNTMGCLMCRRMKKETLKF